MEDVYRVDNTEDTLVTELKQELIDADNGNNPDLVILFKGYMHSKTGFKYRAENIEVFDAALWDSWKEIIVKKGLNCDINADLSNAWVEISCKRVLRHRKSIRSAFSLPKLSCFDITRIPLKLLAYLVILFFSIYILWIRHEKYLK